MHFDHEIFSEMREMSQLVQRVHDENMQLRMRMDGIESVPPSHRPPETINRSRIADAVRDLQAAGAHVSSTSSTIRTK